MKKRKDAKGLLEKASSRDAKGILKKIEKMLKAGEPEAEIEEALAVELQAFVKKNREPITDVLND